MTKISFAGQQRIQPEPKILLGTLADRCSVENHVETRLRDFSPATLSAVLRRPVRHVCEVDISNDFLRLAFMRR